MVADVPLQMTPALDTDVMATVGVVLTFTGIVISALVQLFMSVPVML